MTLAEFFDYLAYSQLSQYALGTSNNGTISESDYPRLAMLTNMGLSRLHTKLNLKMDQVILRVNSFENKYILSSKFAKTAPAVDGISRYIEDTVNPFTDNIIKIEQVVHESNGEYTLNDETDENTIFTPNYRTLQFAQPNDGLISVIYRANHTKIPVSRTLDPDSIELDISDILIEALGVYVAASVVGSGGNGESSQEGLILMGQFNRRIESLKLEGIDQVDLSSSNRIWRDKWV